MKIFSFAAVILLLPVCAAFGQFNQSNGFVKTSRDPLLPVPNDSIIHPQHEFIAKYY